MRACIENSDAHILKSDSARTGVDFVVCLQLVQLSMWQEMSMPEVIAKGRTQAYGKDNHHHLCNWPPHPEHHRRPSDSCLQVRRNHPEQQDTQCKHWIQEECSNDHDMDKRYKQFTGSPEITGDEEQQTNDEGKRGWSSY
eukprot:CAMPEP_0172937010 /NCGR_PEP_ID=MMETSP1075-20121228/222308_1 /TAXON_ID=2916 /ORGANISM="Ceratium fusus, Strain PA161109" /LENGTH=139 /DNA_ID=CAMNT_0013798385 /DNA_START=512 /DNA_END=931 /DNA_ORIENTATION=+